MKKTASTLALLLAALGGFTVLPLAAGSADDASARMYQVDRVNLRENPITVGTSLNLVRQTIGSPHEQLTPNLWLYHNFQPKSGQAKSQDCYDLIIGFTDERVSSLRIVNPRARDIVIARVNAGESANDRALAAVVETTGAEVAAK